MWWRALHVYYCWLIIRSELHVGVAVPPAISCSLNLSLSLRTLWISIALDLHKEHHALPRWGRIAQKVANPRHTRRPRGYRSACSAGAIGAPTPASPSGWAAFPGRGVVSVGHLEDPGRDRLVDLQLTTDTAILRVNGLHTPSKSATDRSAFSHQHP
jgi:hypothetical protein